MKDNRWGGFLLKVLSILVILILVQSTALAQTSGIPAFPDDDAELVDPSLLDVSTTQKPATTTSTTDTTKTTTTKTTTVPDSGTGTPTLPAILLSALAATLALVLAKRFLKSK